MQRTLHGLMASGPGSDQGSALLGAGWCKASSPGSSEMDRVLMVTSSFGATHRRIGWFCDGSLAGQDGSRSDIRLKAGFGRQQMGSLRMELVRGSHCLNPA